MFVNIGTISLVLLFTSVILGVVAATVYVWWTRYKSTQKQQGIFNTAESITENIDLARQIKNVETGTFQSEKQHTENKSKASPKHTKVSKPAAVIRSFSGQFNIAKMPPSMRRMDKINSQVIMFNGQPYFQEDDSNCHTIQNDFVKPWN